MASIVARIRSRISSSSAPFSCHPLLLSVSMASSSGTRRQAGVSCGSTRRILTPFHFFHQLRDTTFHLFRYIDEQAFRYNNWKDMDDRGRFKLAVSQIVGKQAPYL